MKNIWKKNISLAKFVVGLLSIALCYVVFDEFLWMGMWCSLIGFIELMKQKQKD